MAHHSHEPQVTVLPPNKEKIKHLWKVALYMGIITAVEFVIAFTMTAGHLKTSIFVLLTIVKAGYIVGEFMHLRYETKLLFWSILVPIVFIVWALVAFLYEGMAIAPVRI
jgi:cytochrome c oxidase subunit 4